MQCQITCFELCFSTLIMTTSACPDMFLQVVARQASVLMNSHEKVQGKQQKLYSPIPGQSDAAQRCRSPRYKSMIGKYDFGNILLRQEKPHSAALSTVASCNTNHLQKIWRSSYCVGMKHSFSSLDNPEGATRHAHLSTLQVPPALSESALPCAMVSLKWSRKTPRGKSKVCRNNCT